jgi:hypothetical protein
MMVGHAPRALQKHPEYTPADFRLMLIKERAKGVGWNEISRDTGYSLTQLLRIHGPSQSRRKGVLHKHPNQSPEQFARMLAEERAAGTTWKELHYRTGYSIARLFQLYELSKADQ